MNYLIKIDDFVEDLNYTGVILHIGENVKKEDLRKALEKDEVNHMQRFDEAWDDGFFYIENCDLQTVDVSIEEIFREWGGSWCVLELDQFDSEFYVKVPQLISRAILNTMKEQL